MAARRRSDELERKAREVDTINRRLAKAAAEAGPGKNLGAGRLQHLFPAAHITTLVNIRIPGR